MRRVFGIALALSGLVACQSEAPLSQAELSQMVFTPETLALVVPKLCEPMVTESQLDGKDEADSINAKKPSGKQGFTHACKVRCGNWVDSFGNCPPGTHEEPGCPKGLYVVQVSNFGYVDAATDAEAEKACERKWDDRSASHPLGCAEFAPDVTKIRDENGDEYETTCVPDDDDDDVDAGIDPIPGDGDGDGDGGIDPTPRENDPCLVVSTGTLDAVCIYENMF